MPRPAWLHARRLPRHLREIRWVGQFRQPRGNIALPCSQRRSEIRGGIAYAAPGITTPFGHQGRDRTQGEVTRIDPVNVIPLDGHRYGGSRVRAQRVGRRDHAVLRILVEVDEYPIPALLLPPRHRHDVRMATLELAPQSDRGMADIDEGPPRQDRGDSPETSGG